MSFWYKRRKIPPEGLDTAFGMILIYPNTRWKMERTMILLIVSTFFQLFILYFQVSAPFLHPFQLILFPDNSPHPVTPFFSCLYPLILVLSRAPALDLLSSPKDLYYLLLFHAIVFNSYEIQSPNY